MKTLAIFILTVFSVILGLCLWQPYLFWQVFGTILLAIGWTFWVMCVILADQEE